MRRNAWLGLAVALALMLSAAAPVWAGEGTIQGRVENASTGRPVEGATVVLHVFSEMKEEVLGETTTGADGAFQFSVDYDENKVFWVHTEYSGVRYVSDLLRLSDEEPNAMATLQVYETTDDPAGVQITRGHLIVEFVEGAVHVSELYVVGNMGHATYVGDVEGRTLQFLLPMDAMDVMVDDQPPGEEFVREGDVLWGTAPVPPGPAVAQHIVSYLLPYSPDAGLELVREYAYPVEQVNLMVPQVGVEVTSDLEFVGTVGAERTYLAWRGSSLAPGETWSVRIQGEPAATGGTPGMPAAARPGGATGVPFPLLAGGGLALLALGALAFLGLRRRTVPVQDPERLLDAIARLDEAYEAGELDEEGYRERRQALKEALAKAVATGQGEGRGRVGP